MLFATLLQRRGCRGFGALLLLVALLGLVVQWSSLASTARLHPNSMGSQKAHPKLPHDPSRAAPGGSLKLLELETANARLKEENANLRTQLRIATDEIQRQLVVASTDPATSAPALAESDAMPPTSADEIRGLEGTPRGRIRGNRRVPSAVDRLLQSWGRHGLRGLDVDEGPGLPTAWRQSAAASVDHPG